MAAGGQSSVAARASTRERSMLIIATCRCTICSSWMTRQSRRQRSIRKLKAAVPFFTSRRKRSIGMAVSRSRVKEPRK